LSEILPVNYKFIYVHIFVFALKIRLNSFATSGILPCLTKIFL